MKNSKTEYTKADYSKDSYPANRRVLKVVKGAKGHLLCRIYWATNLRDNVCRMGLKRLGAEIGFDPSTVSRGAKALLKMGYIKMVKPADKANNEPPHYLVTEKYFALLTPLTIVEPQPPEVDAPTPEADPPPIAERNSPIAERNTPIAQCNSPIAERNKEKESDVESKKESEAGGNVKLPNTATPAEIEFVGSHWSIKDWKVQTGVIIFWSVARTRWGNLPRTHSSREKWEKAITEHVGEFPLNELLKLYEDAFKKLEDSGMTIASPASLTNTMHGLHNSSGGSGGKRVKRTPMEQYNKYLSTGIDPDIATDMTTSIFGKGWQNA